MYFGLSSSLLPELYLYNKTTNEPEYHGTVNLLEEQLFSEAQSCNECSTALKRRAIFALGEHKQECSELIRTSSGLYCYSSVILVLRGQPAPDISFCCGFFSSISRVRIGHHGIAWPVGTAKLLWLMHEKERI